MGGDRGSRGLGGWLPPSAHVGVEERALLELELKRGRTHDLKFSTPKGRSRGREGASEELWMRNRGEALQSQDAVGPRRRHSAEDPHLQRRHVVVVVLVVAVCVCVCVCVVSKAKAKGKSVCVCVCVGSHVC